MSGSPASNTTAPTPDDPPATWRESLRSAITDPGELLRFLELDAGLLPGALRGDALFPLRVPRGFARRMRPGDPADPLLRQVLPLAAESRSLPGYGTDPVGDKASMAAPGILHKYRGRVLLIGTGVCAVNCRYCFRRHFPYTDALAARAQWAGALDYVRANPDVHEVILSGGDPLMLATDKLARLTGALESVPHVKRLRIHSRMPVVLPERVDAELLAWLAELRLQKVLVIHSNHPAEVDNSVRQALSRLGDTGVTLFNQSVLLAGVNDSSADVLEHLGETLFAAGVLPYYLHLLDPVDGAAHFNVPVARARELQRELRIRQSGYLVPRLVREVAGAPYKIPVL